MESAKEPQTDRGGGRFFWLLIFVAFYQEKASADKKIAGRSSIVIGNGWRSREIFLLNSRMLNSVS